MAPSCGHCNRCGLRCSLNKTHGVTRKSMAFSVTMATMVNGNHGNFGNNGKNGNGDNHNSNCNCKAGNKSGYQFRKVFKHGALFVCPMLKKLEFP